MPTQQAKSQNKLQAIPTNIITGFLGAGKSSAILHLLKHKPHSERWAVLVNEFGEIGIDAQLIGKQSQNHGGIYIREVAGGCMCCSAGLPMSIALNQLLRQSRADRLLIEPSGLGHPLEVLAVLQSQHYRDVLQIEKSLTLVDARKLSDQRYRQHPSFQQQLAIADVIVANKLDLYQASDIAALEDYAGEKCSLNPQLLFTKQGAIEPECLHGPTLANPEFDAKTARLANIKPTEQESKPKAPIPAVGYLSASNSDGDFHSIGWRIAPSKVFSRAKVLAFFKQLKAERMKAVLITDEGVFAYNYTPQALSEAELDDCLESSAEIIATQLEPNWEESLLSCLIA